MCIRDSLSDVIANIVANHLADHGSDWDLEALWNELKTVYPVGIQISEVLEEAGSRSKLTKAWLTNELVSDARLAYKTRTEEIGEEAMRELERRVVMSVIDRKWRDHLYEMDYLKEGIGLRAMAQRDPLVEYQREGYTMFQVMMGQIREEALTYLFQMEVQVTPAPPIQPTLTYSAPSEDGEAEIVDETPKPKNNGSGSSFFRN